MKQAEAHTLHPAAGATSAIVSFASGLRYADLDDEVRYYARRHLLDTIGVMIAGAPGDVATNAETMLAGVVCQRDPWILLDAVELATES